MGMEWALRARLSRSQRDGPGFRGEGVVWLLAAWLLVFVIAVVMAGCVLIACGCLDAARLHRERLQWEDLVAHHQELDRELEKIWQHR